MASGAFNAAINGGSFRDILKGAAIGGIQGGITGGLLHNAELAAAEAGLFSKESAIHIAGHGVVGGAANEAMGGKFQDGFLSAAVSAAAANAGILGDSSDKRLGAVTSRTIKAGIIGGTAAAIGGGKFSNGAFTAAFQHLLNNEIIDPATAGKSADEAEAYYKKRAAESQKLYTDNKELLDKNLFTTDDQKRTISWDPVTNKAGTFTLDSKAVAIWKKIFYDNGSGGNLGECASLCRNIGAGPASNWTKGTKVVGGNINPGTAIAWFNNKSFSGHAAIFIRQYSNKSILVFDQYTPKNSGRFQRVRILTYDGNSSNGSSKMYTIK